MGWNEQAVLENHSVFVALKMVQTGLGLPSI
jgi:hypothetical protein